ncbi:MAG: hypothetical protein NC548_63795, partial [Lachnospiraceae bacterium]|nr:hypothetical protein [Lachnospiraceae bacterium]
MLTAVSEYAGYAVTYDGKLYGWGSNATYDGINAATNTPTLVKAGQSGEATMDDVIQIRTSGYATVALKSNGTVFTWGQTDVSLGNSTQGTYNATGGQITTNATPIQVLQGAGGVAGKTKNFLENVTDVEVAGAGSTVLFTAVQNGDTGVWWGNAVNQAAVFAATTTSGVTPYKFANGNTTYGSKITRIHGGVVPKNGINMVVEHAGGKTYAHGYVGNSTGAISDTSKGAAWTVYDYVVSGTNGLVDFASSKNNVAIGGAIRMDGSVITWGSINSSGQLGDGSTTASPSVAVQVGGSSSDKLVIAESRIYAKTDTANRNPKKEYTSGIPVIVRLSEDEKLVIDKSKITTNSSFNVFGTGGVASAVTFTSTDEKLATVDQNGVVTPNTNGKYGELEIYVTETSTKIRETFKLQIKPAGALAMPQIVAGTNHMAVLKADGTVWTWGLSAALGTGNTGNSNTPVQVKTSASANLENVVNIAAYGNMTYAVTEDGKLYRWGQATGWNTSSNYILNGATNIYYATQVSGVSNAVLVEIGNYAGYAITSNGDLYGWGADGSFNGTQIATGAPTAVKGGEAGTATLGNIISVKHDGSATIALKSNGTVFTWGYMPNGTNYTTLNGGTTAVSNTPVQVLQGNAVAGKSNKFLENVTDIETVRVNDYDSSSNPNNQNYNQQMFYVVQNGTGYYWGSSIYAGYGYDNDQFIGGNSIQSPGLQVKVPTRLSDKTNVAEIYSNITRLKTSRVARNQHYNAQPYTAAGALMAQHSDSRILVSGYAGNNTGVLLSSAGQNASNYRYINGVYIVSDPIDYVASHNSPIGGAIKQDGSVVAWGNVGSNGEMGNGSNYASTNNPAWVGGSGSEGLSFGAGTLYDKSNTSKAKENYTKVPGVVRLAEDEVFQINTSAITTQYGFNVLKRADKPSNLKFVSTDNTIASVSDSGRITPNTNKIYGEAEVYVYDQDTGLRATVKVEVRPSKAVALPQIVVGANHMAVLKSDGTVWTWGAAAALGTGSTANAVAPAQVKTATASYLTNVIQIAAAGNITYAVTGD